MTTNSSSTAAATSDIATEVAGILRTNAEGRSGEDAARIGRLRQRIQSLESRGFIRRQRFSAPTTGDFEKLMLCKKG